jgi:uncharacterized Rmd1/YagE family protein
MLSALNSKLRRRNSSGSTLPPPLAHPGPKIGPQRTTKNAQKLKLLPNPEFGDEGPEGESGRDGDVYSQYTRIKDPTARRDAARLGKADRSRLPRVTAYCTSNRYNMDGLVHFLKSRVKIRGANPKRFDECVYSPYSYSRASQKMSERLLMVHSAPLGEGREGERERERERRHSDSAVEVDGDASQSRREKLMQMREGEGGNGGENGEASAVQGNVNGDTIPSSDLPTALSHESVPALPPDTADFDTTIHTPEVFLFDYGVVVIWGMSLKDEQRFLKEIAKFETEKLAPDDVETENFNFYYTREYQARIYNDFITLREKGNYMTKLAISHALAQSVKVCLSIPYSASSSPVLPSPFPLPSLPRSLCLSAVELYSPANHPDLPLRSPRRQHDRNLQRPPHRNRARRQDLALPQADQHADRRALHSTHQHPPQRLRARHARAVLDGAAARARVSGRQKLFGDGSEGWVAHGEVGCYCGFAGRAEGSVEPWARGDAGVDR